MAPPFDVLWAAVVELLRDSPNPAVRYMLGEQALKERLERLYSEILQQNVALFPPAGDSPFVEAPMVEIGSKAGRGERDSVEQARTWVWEAAEMLAALPPPGPGILHDDVGFSASNNGPMRTFLANGPEQSDAAYLGALEYLRFHKDTQLPAGEYDAAFKVMKAAARMDEKKAQGLLRGGAVSTLTGGENKNGVWRKTAGGVEIELKRTVKYANIGKAVLEPVGLLYGRDWSWRVEGEGMNRSFILVVKPHAIEAVCVVFEAYGREAMAASLRAANLTWETPAKAETKTETPTLPAPAAPKPASKPTMRGAANVIAAKARELGYTANVWEPRNSTGEFLRVYVDTSKDRRHGYAHINAKLEARFSDLSLPAHEVMQIKAALATYYGYTPPDNDGGSKAPAPVPSTFTAEKQGSNVAVSSTLGGVLGFARASTARPGWYVILRADVNNALVALRSNGMHAEAEIVSAAYGAMADVKALADATGPDDPRLSAATREKVLDLVQPVMDRMAAAGVPYTLRGYQQIGVAFALWKGGRCLIGDDMGVGKTAQAIGAAAALVPDGKTWIVVCPASAVYMWRSQINQWLPWTEVHVVRDGKTPIPSAPSKKARVFILSWTMQSTRSSELLSTHPTLVVFDESHYAKNYKAKRTIAATALADEAPHVILLTGTPAENIGAEIYNQLRMIDRENWPSYTKFADRYFETNSYGKAVSARRDRADELRERLRGYVLRRLKHQVLDLPPKTRDYLWVPMDSKQSKAYNAVLHAVPALTARAWKLRIMRYADSMMSRRLWQLDRATEWVLEQTREEETDADKLVALGYLRRAVGKLKIPVLCDWIEDYLESSEKPVVVFVEHQAVVKGLQVDLEERGVSHVVVDGKASAEAKHDAVQRFQAGEYRVMVATRALREGVTLTAASDMLFGERWWVPTTEEQAEDRIYRSGTGSEVTIHYPMLEDTIDEHMHAMILAKRGELAVTVGGNKYAATEALGKVATSPSAIYATIMREIGAARDLDIRTEVTQDEWDAFLDGEFDVDLTEAADAVEVAS